MMLSSCDKAGLQAVLATAYDQTMAVQRQQGGAQDAGGNTNVAWTTITSGIPCRVSASTMRGSTEGGYADRLAGTVRYRVYCPLGTDVTEKDRLLVGATVYNVTSTDVGRSNALELAIMVDRVA